MSEYYTNLPVDRHWRHTVAGMHTGKMTPKPYNGEFDSCLSVGAEPGTVEDGVRHRHIHLNYVSLDPDAYAQAVDWAFAQVQGERTLLVRSEGGIQRPGLVVASVCIRLGANYYEALSAVSRTRNPLTDFRYLELLRLQAHP